MTWIQMTTNNVKKLTALVEQVDTLASLALADDNPLTWRNTLHQIRDVIKDHNAQR